MIRLIYKQYDLYPTVRATIKDSTGTVVDLTNANDVYFVLFNDETGELIFRKAGAFNSPKTSGIVTYEWDLGDLNDTGEYRAEFIVDWDNAGAIQHTPQSEPIFISVLASVS